MTTSILSAVAASPEKASLEDLARLRRQTPGVPIGSLEINATEQARSHILDVIVATREQLLPEARRMAGDHPDVPAYRDEVARLEALVRDGAQRALVLGERLAYVGDASHIAEAELYELRLGLVARGLLSPAAVHLA